MVSMNGGGRIIAPETCRQGLHKWPRGGGAGRSDGPYRGARAQQTWASSSLVAAPHADSGSHNLVIGFQKSQPPRPRSRPQLSALIVVPFSSILHVLSRAERNESVRIYGDREFDGVLQKKIRSQTGGGDVSSIKGKRVVIVALDRKVNG